MSNLTKNYKLEKPLEDEFYDISIANSNMDIIDKGLTLDVGTSTGTGNNYILDIGSITLAESNKGISFKFFADKDSDGAVTINTNYNLIKPNKNPVKNLKSGAPYIITYDGGSNFFLASGADDSDSTSVGTDGSNVKTGITFVGTDGEVHTGTFTADGTMVASDLLSGKIGYSKGNKITGGMTNRGAINATLGINGKYTIPQGYHNGQGKVTQSIPNRGEYQYANGIGAGNDYISFKQIPYGYYPQSNNGWAPEIRMSKSSLASYLGITSNKIVSGQSICGVSGSASIQSLGGYRVAMGSTNASSNTTAFTKYNSSTIKYYTLTIKQLPFTPKLVIAVRWYNRVPYAISCYRNDNTDQICFAGKDGVISNAVKYTEINVNDSSIVLPVVDGSGEYMWIALG
ncbi:MAG: hypothetical protein E7208_01830 [Clostridium butyricum]|nr:hypothetical protein [Clostridium butyricum]